MFDSNGFPVDGTQFWITIIVEISDNAITLQFPTINFQISEASTGTLRTIDGFLSEKIRPSDPVYHSYLGASNNGMSLPFSFTQDPSTLPTPVVGYIISITIAGGLVIQAAGTFNNQIPAGPQILMPTTVSYLVECRKKVKKNFALSLGPSDITHFSRVPSENAYRDSHVNDAFDGVSAWTWVDNFMVPDKVTGTMNVMVRIGKMKDHKLKLAKPVQLSNFGPNVTSISTAVAINRTNKNNIVVSYGVLDYTTFIEPAYAAVSFDGGKTWPINGPTNIQPVGPFGGGDCRGVSADKYGNFWYEISNYTDPTGNFFFNQPAFWISSDCGRTWSLAYTFPDPTVIGVDYWDFPQLSFGGDGQGNYGMWITADYYQGGIDVIPVMAFIPITGLGSYGTPTLVFLNSLLNTQYVASLTASQDGRVWTQSYTNMLSNYLAFVVRFKSPGPIDSNYAGPWDLAVLQPLSGPAPTGTFTSFPNFGYFNGVQQNVYDDKRQALYSLLCYQTPDLSQDMSLFMIISRDNGQTWSSPLYIATTDRANRGFPSMALDTEKGDLYFGWYDGRNDPTFKKMEYFGAILKAKTINKLVDKIPLSNPLYTLPPATSSVEIVEKNAVHLETRKQQRINLKCRIKCRGGTKD